MLRPKTSSKVLPILPKCLQPIRLKAWGIGLLGTIAGFSPWGLISPSIAQVNESSPRAELSRANASLDRFCRVSDSEAQRKEALRMKAQASPQNQSAYQAIVQEHGRWLQTCRQSHWPDQQAIWLRLYPCDVQDDRLFKVLDQLVSAGYNQVFLEVFYDGRVLLPESENPTAWPSVITTPGYEKVDLMARAIEAGRQRGLEVHAWMFTMNFGYSYSERSDRSAVIARNGRNQSSLDLLEGETQVFIDPYHPLAQSDYAQLLNLVLQRKPDGLLFDYVRYPRGTGTASVVSQVKDLLIYSPAAQAALLKRALNNKGRELIDRFLKKGFVSAGDLDQVNKLYPQEGEPLWQGRSVPPPRPANTPPIPLAQQQARIQQELWLLSVAHAHRGVLDFLETAIRTVRSQNLRAGAVFFPGGNQTVGQFGFDARLQPWDQFSNTIAWNPMSYAACGRTDCILAEIQRVISKAPTGTFIQPVLAGSWNTGGDRPSLEEQMAAIQRSFPQIKAVSHFAYSWQYPQDDRDRKFCRL
ncbi:MAG: family 10 glycosylhydrolase [Prochlorotrichaceae cyanobacterium]